MKVCANPDCPHLKKHGFAAEYRGDVDRCPSCDEVLSPGEGVPLAGAAAVPGFRVDAARGPDRRVVFSALALLGALILGIVWIPGGRDLAAVADGGGGLAGLFNLPPSHLSWAALGVTPILTGLLVVELIALAVPRLRRLRTNGAATRRPLTTVGTWIGLAVLVLQAWMFTSWTRRFTQAFFEPMFGARDLMVMGAALIVGTGVLLALANLVARRGVGNGLAVVIGASLLWGVADELWITVQMVQHGSVAPARVAVVTLSLAALVWGTLRYVGLDDGSVRPAMPRPASGILPVVWAASILSFSTTLRSYGFDTSWLADWAPGDASYAAAYLVLSGLLVPLAAWMFARRRLTAPARARFGAPAVDATTTLRFSLAANLALAAAFGFAASEGLFVSAVSLVILTAIGKDLVGEARFGSQHGALASAWSLQRLYLVEPALALLEREGVPAYPRAVAHRSLWQFFAPWFPVELLVPVEHEARARALLDERLAS